MTSQIASPQPRSEKIYLGIDAGGTFTDFVALVPAASGRTVLVHKTLSTPDAPERAILRGIEEMGLQQALANGELVIVHGSTVATNAALEGKGARTVFVSNRGFADLLEIGRQTRPKLYALQQPPARTKVPRELCVEVPGRIDAKGNEIEALSDAAIAEAVADIEALQPEAVAINLLFSFLAPATETRLQAALQNALPDCFVSRSSEVLPEYKEYERGVATWLNASLGPVVYRYLSALSQALGATPLQIMQSSGETIAAREASLAAVKLLLSGPAGGLTALHRLGAELGVQQFISFDMGGTSTDVALLDGEPATTNEGTIAGLPVGVPMVDMHTIGAGGGSIAYLDSGGMLQVGPRSAGAVPGPVCYGQGGTEVTVTDAHVVLGRIDPSASLAGSLRLDVAAATRAMQTLAQAMGVDIKTAAEGVLAVANEEIAAAIRLISVNRGFDPAQFRLTSFGGAGGLHVCALAEAMNMSRALVPANGGVLSALGMILARPGRQLSQTVTAPLAQLSDADIEQGLATLGDQGRAELFAEGQTQACRAANSVDLRYTGQSYTLNVPWHSRKQARGDFIAQHQQRFGYAHDTDLEIVNLRVKVEAVAEQLDYPQAEVADLAGAPQSGAVPSIGRAQLGSGSHVGPLVITERAATTYIAEGWQVRVDAIGNLDLEKIP